MCERYCECNYCAYDKSKCEEMGDGTPFCGMFRCNIEKCERVECISHEEECIVLGAI